MEYFSYEKNNIGMLWDDTNNDASFCCPDGLTYKKFQNSNKTEEDKKKYLAEYRKCLENEFTSPEALYEESRKILETISFIPFWRRNITEIAMVFVVFITICLGLFIFYCFTVRV